MAHTPDVFNQEEYDKLLKNIDERIKERLEAIDGLQQIFEGRGEIFDALNQKIKENVNLDENAVVKELKNKLNQSKDTLLQGFTDLTKELSTKLDRETETAKRTQIQEAIEKIRTNQAAIENTINNHFANYQKKINTSLTASGTLGDIRAGRTTLGNISGQMLGNVGSQIDLTQQQSAYGLQRPDMSEMLTMSNTSGTIFAAYILKKFGKQIMESVGVDTKSGLGGMLTTSLGAPFGEIAGKIKNLGDSFKGLVLQIKSAVNVIMGLSKSLLAIPLRIIEYAATEGHAIKEDNIKFFNNLEKLQDSFRQSSGVGQSFVGLNKQLRSRRLSYLDPNNPAARLYGAKGDDLIERQLEETSSIIKSMGPRAELMAKTVTRNVTAADSSVANYYYKAKKLMNLSEEDMGKLTNMAISLGKSFPEVFDEISKATADVANRFSLDFKMMSADVLTLRKDIVNFGHKSVDELAEVAGHIRQMGVSMSDAMSVFNKFQTFEDAATTAAQLSQTFGMVVDSMELLKAQSPDEILQQYKDAFQASGKSFETMDRFSKSLILQQTGLSDQAAQALFSAENAGKTYEEIMADIEAKDPVKQQTKHMEEMRDAIVELKSTLTDKFTSFFDAMQEGFTQRLFENPTIRRSMERMALAMDNIFLKFTRLDLKKFQPLIERMTVWIDKLANYLFSNKFLKQLEGIAFAIGDIIDGFTGGGKQKLEKGLTSLRKSVQPIYEFLAGIGAEILKNTALALVEALPSIVGAINTLLDDVIANLTDTTTEPKKQGVLDKLFSLTPESKKSLLASLESLAENIFGGKKDKSGGLLGRIGTLIEKVKEKMNGSGGILDIVMNKMKEGFNNILKDNDVTESFKKIGSTIVEGITTNEKLVSHFKDLATILGFELTNGWFSNNEKVKAAEQRLNSASQQSPQPPAPSQPQVQTPQDLIISDKGSFMLDSKDDVMALKPGGAIEEYMKMTAGNSLNRNNMQELKTMIVEAMTASLQGMVNNSGGDRELVVNLDSQKVGSVLIKGGLATMMTNPNIAGSQPILNPTSITTANGQSYSSPYRNS